VVCSAELLKLLESLEKDFLLTLVDLEFVPELNDFQLSIDDNSLFKGVWWNSTCRRANNKLLVVVMLWFGILVCVCIFIAT
jgi:hypothetical protein